MTSPFAGQPGEYMPQPGAGAPTGGGGGQVAVAVVDADQAARSRLAMQLGQGATPVPVHQRPGLAAGSIPVVIVLGPSFAGSPELAAVEQLLAARRDVGAIMVTNELSTELLQRALRSGVKDVLAGPDRDRRSWPRPSPGWPPGLVMAAPCPAVPSVIDADGELGRVITVFCTKGGAGQVGRRHQPGGRCWPGGPSRPVVLVDADLQFGDVAVMLKLSPQHTIADAVSVDRPPRRCRCWRACSCATQLSGLLVLPAPPEPAFADQIGAAEMVRILEMLRTFCAYVVVDTPAVLHRGRARPHRGSRRHRCSWPGMDVPNIKNVKIGLQTLRLLNTADEQAAAWCSTGPTPRSSST